MPNFSTDTVSAASMSSHRLGMGAGGRRFVAPEARILLVDDVRTNQRVAMGFLDEYQCQIDTCNNGFAAIHMVQARRYDMVFMDYMMPKMNGIKTTQKIRSGGDWGLPIVALTASATRGAQEMFLSEGFSDYLNKPIEKFKLDKILKKWLPLEKQLRVTPAAGAEEGAAIRNLALEGVDTRAGHLCYGEKTYLSLLDSYLTCVPALLEKLRRPGRIEEYLAAVHGLKSASYGICADALGKQAEALECAAKAGSFRFIEAHNDGLLAAAGSLLRELEAFFIAREHEADAKPTVPEPSPALLRELAAASREYKVTAMEAIMDELEAYRYANGGNFLVKWLREQVNNLEYKAIWKRLLNDETVWCEK